MRYTNCVEKERADRSVSFCVMNEASTPCGLLRASSRGFSPIFITAAISLVALVAVAGWQITASIQARNNATSYVATSGSQAATDEASAANSALASEDGTTPVGTSVIDDLVANYMSLQQQGLYTREVGEATAKKMAADLQAPLSYRQYSQGDIQTTADTSYARMIAYRNDLQISLAPLMKNTEPEYEIFAYYVSTKDKKNLEKLQLAAQNYRAAARATLGVVTPKDAIAHQLGILNAMEEFSAALDALVVSADDPFASVVVLRSYNQAEADVLTSFASLAKYYREKQS